MMSGSKRKVVSDLERRPLLDLPICKFSAPDEAEASSAGKQLCRGIVRRAHRADEGRAW